MNDLPKDNFKKESKLMSGLFIGVVLVGFIAALAIPHLINFMAKDRCLDAGGSYDSKTGICIGAGGQPIKK